MRKLLLVCAVVAAVLIPGSPAWAHAQLLSSDPAKDATLTEAPAAVALKFSERLNPDFTTIVISDAARQRVAGSPPAVDKGTGTVTLDQPLGNGAYTVAYRVVSVDGHTVQGSYAFTVADPARPAAVAAPAPSAAAAAATDAGGTPGAGPLLGFGVVLVLLAALAIYLYVTIRRRTAARA